MGFVEENVVPLVDAGLGNSAYLVDLGAGRGLVVDATRDLRPVRAAAQRRGLRVAFAADTHLHADFLTGAVQLAHDDGAVVLASAAGRRSFDHAPLVDEQEVDLGGLRLRALATPGHTDEHLSFLLLDGRRELGVFTGGSLIVDSAARTDLLGAERTEELARAQYRSLQRLAALPDDTHVWPTHGAGSFCSAPAGADRTSTVGRQRRSNPLLAAPDEETFVARLTGGLGSYPAYFARLAERNRRGTGLAGPAPGLPPLDPAGVSGLLAGDGYVVDARPAAEFATGHLPGSVSIPLREEFATWLGWLLPDDAPLCFVLSDGADAQELVWQAHKIGYDRLTGYLAGGVAAWRAAGGHLQATPFLSAARAPLAPYLDVRQDAEYAAGHVPGAVHVELPALPEQTGEVPLGALVGCARGLRAMTAASLLERVGRTDLTVLDGRPQDYAAAHGLQLV
ncbi:MBL fold metallo-hydrolase [Ornithinicoccus halotolerans]|uniref:MBL fold metallo-hydrolase n=1 Tax=Ornithinicoccus halotolerans TaxID=1748220 RepID=UPI001296336F|nr:MBL fold metallo-hydrolase [Ornithinicoccus halotolerans]